MNTLQTFELPTDFRFDEINSEKYEKSREVFTAAISPCILPVGICQGRNIQISYEFYHPMSVARQMGIGELPIGLYYSEKIQVRGEITSALMMDRLLNLQGPPLGSVNNIELAMLSSSIFDQWWAEWKKHLFHQLASMYLTDILPDMVPQVNMPFLSIPSLIADFLKKKNLRSFSSLFADHKIFSSPCQQKWSKHQICCWANTKWWWISIFIDRL